MTGREYNNQFSEEELKNEIWKDAPEWKDMYQVSNLGRVKSLERYRKNYSKLQKVEERIMIPFKSNYRYFCIYLSLDSKSIVKLIHRLVFETFIEKIEKGKECCHNDGNFTNNRVENLRQATHRDNLLDKIKHKTHNRGERSPSAKLTYADILKIRELNNTGKYYHREIAKMFNTSRSNISLIVNYINWRYQPD